MERSRKQYVGTADVSDHAIFVKMDPRRMPMDVYLSKRDNPNVQHGDKVVIRITDWALGSKSPAGELVEVLGRAGENNTEMHAILAEYGLPYHFEQRSKMRPRPFLRRSPKPIMPPGATSAR